MDADQGDHPTLEQHIARARETRERLAKELVELVAAEQVIYDDLKAQADESKARRDGYQRALDHIAGFKAPAAAAKSPAKRSKHDWSPKEETVREVHAGFLALFESTGAPVTRNALVATLPIGQDTVRKSLDILREREEIRIAARTRGGGKAYAPMPSEDSEPRVSLAA